MTAEYIQDCSNGSPILDYYADREYEWMKAGKEIKKAIAAYQFEAWFPFTFEFLNNVNYTTVQRMRYRNELYAIVTNSAINYIFKIDQ